MRTREEWIAVYRAHAEACDAEADAVEATHPGAAICARSAAESFLAQAARWEAGAALPAPMWVIDYLPDGTHCKRPATADEQMEFRGVCAAYGVAFERLMARQGCVTVSELTEEVRHAIGDR